MVTTENVDNRVVAKRACARAVMLDLTLLEVVGYCFVVVVVYVPCNLDALLSECVS